MRLGRKVVALALVVFMSLGLCACGGEVGADGSDASGKDAVLKTKIEKTYNGKELQRTYTINYDENGEIIFTVEEYADGDILEMEYEWKEKTETNGVQVITEDSVERYRIECVFDKDGNITSSVMYIEGGAMLSEIESKYVEGVLVERITRSYNGEDILYYKIEEYDENENLIMRDMTSYQYIEGQSAYENREIVEYEYEYDEHDRVIKGTGMSEDSFIEEVTYEYDKYGNLILEKWNRAKTSQTIEYEYY